jgi:hypothetical protein
VAPSKSTFDADAATAADAETNTTNNTVSTASAVPTRAAIIIVSDPTRIPSYRPRHF